MRGNINKIATIFLLGSVWGLLEATIGGALHMVHFSLTGQIMASIGAGVLLLGLRAGIAPFNLMGIAVIAASFKFADAFLFSLPISHITIINPAQAILMEGLCFATVAHVFKSFEKNPLNKIAFSSLFVVGSIVLFNLVSYFVIGNKNTMHLQNIERTLALSIPIGIAATYASLSAASFLWARLFNKPFALIISAPWRAVLALGCAAGAIYIRTILA